MSKVPSVTFLWDKLFCSRVAGSLGWIGMFGDFQSSIVSL